MSSSPPKMQISPDKYTTQSVPKTNIQKEEKEHIELDHEEVSGDTRTGCVAQNQDQNLLSEAWEALERTIQTHYYEPDLDAARVLYGSIAAHQLTGQPCWPMLIAPPGSMKTELLASLKGLPNIWVIDSVTPKTFLSGQWGSRQGDAPSSLLDRIGDSGIILMPDFSTFLGGRRDDRAAIYADLRRIFDGDLEKHYGTRGGDLSWTGRITAAAAATPAIDKVSSFEGALGDRFVRIRMARGNSEAAMVAMDQDIIRAKAAMQGAVKQVFSLIPKGVQPVATQALKRRIANLGDFAAIARTHVSRDLLSREIDDDYVANAESATRLAQQFYQLARGLALLSGRDTVTEADVAILVRVAMDTIPPRRAYVIRTLLTGEDISKSDTATSDTFSELEHLGLLVKDEKRFTERGEELIAVLKTPA